MINNILFHLKIASKNQKSAWFIFAIFCGAIFLQYHIQFRVVQASDYYFLTSKTTYQTDALIYSSFSQSIKHNFGFPSDCGIFEHRGVTLFPYLTYTLPCWFSALLSTIMGGNSELGYQFGSFLSIFLTVIFIYPLLNSLSRSIPEKFFLVLFFLCFSTYCLRNPSLVPYLVKSISTRPHPLNEFFQPHNIQYSFLFYAFMLSSLCMLLKNPGSKAIILIAGTSLAASAYTYFYYGLQAAMIGILLFILSIIHKDWKNSRALIIVGLVSLIFLLPFFYEYLKFINSPIYQDYLNRFGVNNQNDFLKHGLIILFVSFAYIFITFKKGIFFQRGRQLIASNTAGVGLLIIFLTLSKVNIQNGHLVARAFYPVMGLLIADFIVIGINIIAQNINYLFFKYRSKYHPATLVNSTLLIFSAFLIVLQLHTINCLVQTNVGYFTLNKGVSKSLKWIKKNKNQDDVYLTSDPEMIRLLPTHAGAWTFLSVGTTTVSSNEELFNRIAWGYALLGITPNELFNRMNRQLHDRIKFGILKWKRQTLDYDQFQYADWSYMHFGRTFLTKTSGLKQMITNEDGELGKLALEGKIYEYIPVSIQNKLGSLLEKYQNLSINKCPYRVTHLISTPFDRRGKSDISIGILKDNLRLLFNMDGYRIYEICQ